MTHPLNKQEDYLSEDDVDDILDNITEDDYVIVMDAEGNLKTMIMPEGFNADSVPEKIQKAFESFGIKSITPRVLH